MERFKYCLFYRKDMEYTMKQVEKAVANLMVKPILDYLQQKKPSEEYYSKNREVVFGDGHAFGNEIMICQRRSGLLERIFPKKIAFIRQNTILGKNNLKVTSFDESIITQEQIKDLLRTTDFHALRFCGALAGQSAVDYF